MLARQVLLWPGLTSLIWIRSLRANNFLCGYRMILIFESKRNVFCGPVFNRSLFSIIERERSWLDHSFLHDYFFHRHYFVFTSLVFPNSENKYSTYFWKLYAVFFSALSNKMAILSIKMFSFLCNTALCSPLSVSFFSLTRDSSSEEIL